MKIVAILLLLTSVLVAQQTPPNTKDLPTADCASLEAPLSCKSYNELVQSNDAHVIAMVGHGAYDAYVCFLTDEDTFSIVAIPKAYSFAYRKSPTDAQILEQRAHITFHRFKNGIQYDVRYITGKWTKYAGLDAEPEFVPTKGMPDSAQVDDSSVGLQYSYQNTHHEKVTYDLEIRRSTKRFVETFDIPPAPKKEPFRITNTGHCAEFLPR